MENKNIELLKATIYVVIGIILFFFVIIIAKQILIPISLSFLFATLIYPLTWLLHEKLKFPRTVAVLVGVLTFVAVIFVFFNLLIRYLFSFKDLTVRIINSILKSHTVIYYRVYVFCS